ncbi:MAG: MATE family efflux transporter [Vallitalea sp.]|jgi:putative MATE family efflux protein|nr:MATE family efflux transporter [Vallitalea sp.]
MNKNNKILLMKEGNITTSLFKLGIPMVVVMLVIALYNIVDAYFVSNLGTGTSQVGAVSIAFPISLIFSGVGLTFGTGGGSYISRLLGAKNNKKADQVATTALFTSLIIGTILVLVILIFLHPILLFMGATETILPYAKSYATIFVISMFFSTINVTTGNLVIAQGASTITLASMLTGSILNILLDPLLIYGFNMGVQGAAIATLISQIVTTCIYLWFFNSSKSYITIIPSNFTPTLEIYVQILKIGISMLLLQLLSSLSMSLITKYSSEYGNDEAIAAIGIVLRVITLGSNVVFGFMKGFQPFAGFNYGAKNFIRLKKSITSCIKLTTTFSIIWTIIMFIFAHPIISLFSSDPTVIRIGEKALRANAIMFFTFGFQFTFSTLYLAIGKAFCGGLLNICRQGICFIPIILLFPKFLGLDGVIYSQAIADAITTIVTLFFALKIKHELNQLSREEPLAYSNVV